MQKMFIFNFTFATVKYFYIFFLVFICSEVSAQEELKIGVFYYPISNFDSPVDIFSPQKDFLDDLHGVKLISIRTINPYFQKTYFISTEGETIFSSFMPNIYFNQGNEWKMINGINSSYRNPYIRNSSSLFQSDAFNGFVNTFISQYKLSIAV